MNLQRSLWALLCVFVLACGTASGEFTAAEKTELKKLRAVSLDARQFAADNCSEQTSPHDACLDMYQGLYNLKDAIGWLFHINVQGNNRAGEDFLNNSPREDVVQRAYDQLDFAIAQFNSAASSLEGSSFVDPVNGFINTLNSFDRELGYLDWAPPSAPRQFGPHGDYQVAQQRIDRCLRYGNPAQSDMVQALKTGLPGSISVWLQMTTVGIGHCIDIYYLSAHVIDTTEVANGYCPGLCAGLPEGDTKSAFVEIALGGQRDNRKPGFGDTFHRAMIAGSDSNGASIVENMATIEDATVRAAVAADLRNAFRRFTDAWRFLDAWFDDFMQIVYVPGSDPPERIE